MSLNRILKLIPESWTCLLVLLCGSPAQAQTDTGRAEVAVEAPRTLMVRKLDQIDVTGIQPSARHLTSLHIERYSLADLERRTPYNLSDALAQLPGISQLSTGNAISKPVIRGLYGNRVLVLLSGLRFDNQQFQDEHGLGLSQIGIDRVEIIRGPASILYGTDAIGGVINVIEEKPAAAGTRLDAGVRLYSNTLGTLSDVGILHRGADRQPWWRVRGGYESHGDYSDGAGARVFDSRNTGYYLKAGFGFDHPRWEMNTAYNLSYNQFGFILDSLLAHGIQDARWSRSMQNPHHNVLLNTLSSQNTFYLNRTATPYDGLANATGAILKVNAGLQSNRRAEDEGGGSISLNMHLASVLESARLEKYIVRRLQLILSQQATFEGNTNYGKRILIPDAGLVENGFSGFLRYQWRKGVVEAGAGTTLKSIHTYETGALNPPGTAVAPFSKIWTGYNFLGGVTYNPAATLNIKANISTGLRAPNLAELSSEGLHEGTYRFELGDPSLRLERVTGGDLTIGKTGRNYTLSVSGYLNVFKDYIYLAQTPDTILGLFPLFRYRQQDARTGGLEVAGTYKISDHFSLMESFDYVRGTTTDGGNLPFIPPAKNLLSVRYQISAWKGLRQIGIEPEAAYHFRYTHTGPFELPNADYLLLNLHTSATFQLGSHVYSAGLSFRNLLNTTYTDALSRLRYYGINNQGFNVVLSLRTSLGLGK